MSYFSVTLRPTGRFEQFEGKRCRMWEGTTNSGTKVEFYVPCVRTPSDKGSPDLDAALQLIEAKRELVSFDTRLL